MPDVDDVPTCILGPTVKVVFCRHGESEWNALNQFCGWFDAARSESGRAVAKAGGVALKEQGYTFDACHSSVLQRANTTAAIILEELGAAESVPIEKTWRLNERHYGGLTGLNKASVRNPSLATENLLDNADGVGVLGGLSGRQPATFIYADGRSLDDVIVSKAETAEKYGEDQVKIWRRSFDVPVENQEPPLPTERLLEGTGGLRRRLANAGRSTPSSGRARKICTRSVSFNILLLALIDANNPATFRSMRSPAALSFC